jgi:hypothetical protein
MKKIGNKIIMNDEINRSQSLTDHEIAIIIYLFFYSEFETRGFNFMTFKIPSFAKQVMFLIFLRYSIDDIVKPFWPVKVYYLLIEYR